MGRALSGRGRGRAGGPVVSADAQSAHHRGIGRDRDRALRTRYPRWGGKKILAVLGEREPTWALPAVSTANDILKRAGLVPPRAGGAPSDTRAIVATPVTEPNRVWTADFKGQFRTTDAQLCYPLTVCDAWSRYLVRCFALRRPTTGDTMAVFRRAFPEYRLPHRIRTDNGEPFAAASLGRLSRLSVWWIRLGIYPDLIEPASPYQNGAHERMHRTLKADTTRPPAPNLAAQQQRFARFRRRYNQDRPHEALGQQPSRPALSALAAADAHAADAADLSRALRTAPRVLSRRDVVALDVDRD